MNPLHEVVRYCGVLSVALERAWGLVGLIILDWLAFPFAVKMVLHPDHALGFGYWLQGQPVPSYFTSQMLAVGLMKALMAIGILSLLMLGLVVLFYRKTQFALPLWPLWPLAVAVTGVLGNGAWWIGTGSFDAIGALVGLSPMALAVVCQVVCEQLGQDFVFGKGARPQYNPWGGRRGI
jgi:hypothetical protein